MSENVLDLFHPAVARWFSESFAEPTPPQRDGWPHIAAGENTLVLAPTGSGKTLAAFLYAIDELLKRGNVKERPAGVHTLYISPLKALANDIERNLEAPRAGVRRCAEHMGIRLPEITVGLRTGDTAPAVRRRMVQHPPDLLVTTPESLHLILTSPKARDMLRTIQYVIVDEIHSLFPDKRGTFTALLLERLEALAGRSPVRIGLSATQRPLDLVAQFLGGFLEDGMPRPVSIVDGGMRKGLDLRVECPVPDMKALPATGGAGPTIWPSVHQHLLDAVGEHTSTLIFANNRRLVERIAAEMNRLAGERLVRAHHGSVSKEQRLEIEEELKAGRLPALVATSSLELGIDVGAIDLVCQIETPTSVASGLQRVGRSGHLYRQMSKGRLIPKTRDDLLRMAAMAHAMQVGEISSVRAPENALDVLAQQIVAMVALQPWEADVLFARVRQAYPYHRLPREAFDSVLELVSGRFRSATVSALRPRIAWDRARNLLEPLPGARQVVVLNGGTIPVSGQYPMVLEDRKTKLGELDEEFVFERRLGQTILLGTSRWTILEIGSDRVIVAPSEETEAVMPFWKGEGLGQDAEFGECLGRFIRACGEHARSPDFEDWLAETCALDSNAVSNLATYVNDQLERGGAVPDDRTAFLDLFRNEMGDARLAILTPFGRAFHLALLLALQGTLRADGVQLPQAVFSNSGIVLRPGSVPANVLIDACRSLSAGAVEARITEELEKTPFFAMRFRRNAARALLLPRAKPGRRTPLWLQRLRSHDLLEYARDREGFPIIVETYREILEDLLPLDALKQFLKRVEDGEARFAVRRAPTPSPFASTLLLEFTAGYFYDEDEPEPSRADRSARRGVLDLLRGAVEGVQIDAAALRRLEERMQGIADFERARDGVELVDMLRRIGDLAEEEIAMRAEPPALAALPDLVADGRVARIEPEGEVPGGRLIAEEDVETYSRRSTEDVDRIVRRFAGNRGGVTREEIESRYPGTAEAVDRLLAAGDLVEVARGDDRPLILEPEVLGAARRMTLSKRRSSVRSVPVSRYIDALLRRQHLLDPLPGEEGLGEVMDQLVGWFAPVQAWDVILTARLRPYRPSALEEEIRLGELVWRGRTTDSGRRAIGFAPSEHAGLLRPSNAPGESDRAALAISEFLGEHGASYVHQIAAGLERGPSEVAATLWDMIWDGRVTNDSLLPARAGRPTGEARRSRRRSPSGGGRWSVVRDPDGGALDVSACLRVLFHRYGLLCRETVERDGLGLRWREAYPILTRMEWRGDAERGLFVEGLSSPQFAAPVFSRLLQEEPDGRSGAILLHAFDPANLFGSIIPVLREDGEPYVLRHHPGNGVVVREGRPILAIDAYGTRLTPLVALPEEERIEALSCLRALVEGPWRRTSIRVRTWGGRPILETPAATDLERLGFMREDPFMILYRAFDEAP